MREKGSNITLIQNDLLKSEDNQSLNVKGSGSKLERHGKVILIKKDSYVEADAISQLEETAKLLNMVCISL